MRWACWTMTCLASLSAWAKLSSCDMDTLLKLTASVQRKNRQHLQTTAPAARRRLCYLCRLVNLGGLGDFREKGTRLGEMGMSCNARREYWTFVLWGRRDWRLLV